MHSTTVKFGRKQKLFRLAKISYKRSYFGDLVSVRLKSVVVNRPESCKLTIERMCGIYR